MTKNLRNTTIPHMLPSLVRTLVVVSFLLGGMAAYTKAQADTTTIFPGPIVPGQIRITMVTLDPETLEIPVDGFTSSEAFTLSIGIRNLNSTSRLIPTRLNFKIFEEDPVDPVASPTGSEPSGEGEVLFNESAEFERFPGVAPGEATTLEGSISRSAFQLNRLCFRSGTSPDFNNCTSGGVREQEIDNLGSGLEFFATGTIDYSFLVPDPNLDIPNIPVEQIGIIQLGVLDPGREELGVAFNSRQIPVPSTLPLFGAGLLALGLAVASKK